MILYQMAKMVEQRSRLQHTIDTADGEADQLIRQREQMDEELRGYANRFIADALYES